MKTAIIFPGQGSQSVGMGYDFYEKYQASRKVYNELDNFLDRGLKDIIFSGSISELSQTENSQPAIMATSIAILEAIKYENLLPINSFQAVAGHSLGEYSALVANGSIIFEESVRLLKVRSKAMQESMPLGTGGMIALIGCKNDSVNMIIDTASEKGKIYLANDNAQGQVVLSGEKNAIEFILDNTKNLNIKRAIKLQVSAPFHCELMKHASNVIESELKKIKFKNFNVPLYSNVTSNICDSSDIADLLRMQVISKVRWREIIENMQKDGFRRFIEIGPGTVLTNLIRRVSKNLEAYSISKVEDLEILRKIQS
jgi:[acyl-carrier-protein] S-malonyltransferase